MEAGQGPQAGVPLRRGNDPPLPGAECVAAERVWVGPAGWSYADWKGIVYPKDQRDPLAYISSFFDLVEINSTFYRPCAPKTAESWLRRIRHRPRFRFTVKLWGKFTHEEREWSAGDCTLFREGIEPLRSGGRLGCLLAQFPWSFRRDAAHEAALARLLDHWQGWPLAVEVRHASWDEESVESFLKAREVSFCNIDQPLHRDSLPPSARVTSPVAYVRLHGRNYRNWFREGAGRDERYDYLYSLAELEPWAQRVEALAREAGEVYVVTNNHFQGKAVINALQIIHLLTGRLVPVPPDLLGHAPELAAAAEPRQDSQDPQGSLFS